MNEKKNLVKFLFILLVIICPIRTNADIDLSDNLSFLPEEKFSMSLVDADVRNLIGIIGKIYKVNFLVNESVKGTMSVNFHNVPIRDAFKAILLNFELNFVQSGNIIRIDKFKDLEKKRINAPLITRAINVKYTFDSTASISGNNVGMNLTTLAESLEKLLSGREGAVISVIGRTNTLLITDIAESVDRIEKLIRNLDQKTKQIKIMARIIEANDDFAKQLGVAWGGVAKANTPSNSNEFQIRGGGNYDSAASQVIAREGVGRQGRAYVQDAASLVGIGNLAGPGGASIDFLLGRVSSNFLDLQLSAMERNNDGKILASPKVITQNNMMAMIKSGLRVPIQTIEDGTVTVKYVDALIRLDVLPHIIEDSIFLDLKVIKDDVGKLGPGGNPFLLKKEITTKVLVRNGETVVIGGLITQEETSTTKGVPLFSKIPLLGWLFRFEEKIKTKNELLIFITPSVIDERGDSDYSKLSRFDFGRETSKK